jgi:hypothetical protein
MRVCNFMQHIILLCVLLKPLHLFVLHLFFIEGGFEWIWSDISLVSDEQLPFVARKARPQILQNIAQMEKGEEQRSLNLKLI